MPDAWASWLAQRRHGGDPDVLAQRLAMLTPIRDRVIAAAHIGKDDRVLDVGCGDGLLGFAAAERAATVVFSDISADLVQRCRDLAAELRPPAACEFVNTGLPALAGIGDMSVDVAMTRSVLIYLSDKPASMAGLFRVLRPGGRLSIFEPINRFAKCWADFGFDVTGCEEVVAKVWSAIASTSETLVDFDERDLLDWALLAGFTQVRLTYEAHVGIPQDRPLSWHTFLHTAPNPLAPTAAEVLETELTPDERAAFEACIRPQVEAGTGRDRMAVAYLSAIRPPG